MIRSGTLEWDSVHTEGFAGEKMGCQAVVSSCCRCKMEEDSEISMEERGASDHAAIEREILELLQNHSTTQYTIKDVAAVDGISVVNRLFSATIIFKDQKDANITADLPEHGNRKVLFRFPKFPDEEEMKQLAAVLSFLSSREIYLKTPRLLEYDVREGDGNPLKYPYLLMDYMPGLSLDKVYSKLSFQQKLHVVQEVIKLIAALEALEVPHAGKIRPADEISDFQSFGMDNTNGHIEFDPFLPDREPSNSLAELITTSFEYWRKIMIKDLDLAEVQAEDFGRLWAIKEGMRKRGEFSDEGCEAILLHHWDLFPRNIIVQLVSSDKTDSAVNLEDLNARVEIIAVIDWDDPRSVPRVLTRQPPKWLWGCHAPHQIPEYYYGNDIPCKNENDADLFGQDRYGRNCKEPISNENLAIKAFFDTQIEKTLPGYNEDAYGSGRWIRRVWKFLAEGIEMDIEYKRFEDFLRDWQEEHADSDDESESEESDDEGDEEDSEDIEIEDNKGDESGQEEEISDADLTPETHLKAEGVVDTEPNSQNRRHTIFGKIWKGFRGNMSRTAIGVLGLAVLVGNRKIVGGVNK